MQYTDEDGQYWIVVISDDKNVGIDLISFFEVNQKDAIFIADANNDTGYVFYLSDNVIDVLREEDGIVAEKYKWYQTGGSSIYASGLTEYKGSYPLNSYEFTADEIKCESYLQKIIDSFQK